VVFIKTKIVSPLKFHPKLNVSSRQHQSNCLTCLIINFLILFFKKKKN
jgi:hypothetical protein